MPLPTNEALMILGMFAVTFGVRYPVLALVGRVELPGPVLRALRYVPPAVLTAIIIPEVLLPEGQLALQFSNAALAAGIICAVVAWRTKNLLLTIIIGMLAQFIWRALFAQ